MAQTQGIRLPVLPGNQTAGEILQANEALARHVLSRLRGLKLGEVVASRYTPPGMHEYPPGSGNFHHHSFGALFYEFEVDCEGESLPCLT